MSRIERDERFVSTPARAPNSGDRVELDVPAQIDTQNLVRLWDIQLPVVGSPLCPARDVHEVKCLPISGLACFSYVVMAPVPASDCALLVCL